MYRHFLANREFNSGCFNAGFENLKIIDIAEKVQEKTNAELIVTESNDPRSYRQDSTKLLATGFKPKYTVENAIDEIKEAYLKKQLNDGENCYTVKWMNKLGLNG